jgi:hypothetical protein
LVDIVDVDSMVSDVNTYFGQLQDPYGTLKGSFIFIAEVPRTVGYRNEVGVFKDGQILWDSGPIIEGTLGRIFSTLDLTNSGKVDIIATWLEGAGGAGEDMWIFSWDGKNGVPINPYDSIIGSYINGNRGSFAIQDINGNGKYVITCQLDTADVGYSWNGTSFQTITSPPVLTNNTFSPANNFSMTVSAKATTVLDGYKYNYLVNNDPSSAQSINNVMIAACLDNIRERAPEGWTCLAVKNASLARFAVEIGTENILAPGMTLKGFEIVSNCLPGISKCYAQAPHKAPNYAPEDFLAHQSEFINDFLTNSVSGFTIAPVKWLLPFVPMDFLDTLISYKDRSVTLGWLKNGKTNTKDCDETMNGREWYRKGDFEQYRRWEPDNDWNFDRDWNIGIVKVLNRRLGKARAELSRKDSVGARRDLEIFVLEVELLYRLTTKLEARRQPPIMTSEAYALLKYNGEYLIDALPARRLRH